MVVKYKHEFSKRIAKAPAKVQLAFGERGRIFINNPFHPQLNNHKLTGKYEGYRSINITGDWRAIFKMKEPDAAVFVAIGTHSTLYE